MTAIRLTFSVENGVPKLIKQSRVTMRVPKARHLNMMDRDIGTWFETRDKDGERLYARILNEQVLSPMIEVRTGVAEPGLIQMEAPQERLMHIVVPASDDAKSFHIMRRDTLGGKAKELLSGDL